MNNLIKNFRAVFEFFSGDCKKTLEGGGGGGALYVLFKTRVGVFYAI